MNCTVNGNPALASRKLVWNAGWRSRGERQAVVTRAIKTGGDHVVTLRANWNRKYPVRRGPGRSLSQYLKQAPDFIANYDLPMGASLEATSAGHFQLGVPKLQFMDGTSAHGSIRDLQFLAPCGVCHR